MANARINLKNIDYFKFKKLIIDGNRDDFSACSKDVKLLCDCVQTINFRDEEFDDESDRERFDELCSLYKQLLSSKRIEPMDMKIKSGWWGDHKNAYSAGKLKAAVLKSTLISKATAWVALHPGCALKTGDITSQITGPGLYVFKHKEHQCFQYVGRASNIYTACADKLKAAFDATASEPIAALMTINMSSDWDFYFLPVGEKDDDKLLRILENDLILRHDSIWPHGLNFNLHINSLLEVSQFRKSCCRHGWPPSDDAIDDELSIPRLRKIIEGKEDLIAKESPDKPIWSPISETSSSVSDSAMHSSKKSGETPTGRPTGVKSRSSLPGKRDVTSSPRTTKSSNLVSPRTVTAERKTPRQVRQVPVRKTRGSANAGADDTTTPNSSGIPKATDSVQASPKKSPKATKVQRSPAPSPARSPARSPDGSLGSSLDSRPPSLVMSAPETRLIDSSSYEVISCSHLKHSPVEEPVKPQPNDELKTSVQIEVCATVEDEKDATPHFVDLADQIVAPTVDETPAGVAVDSTASVVPGRRSSNVSVSSGGTWTVEDCDETNPEDLPVVTPLTSADGTDD